MILHRSIVLFVLALGLLLSYPFRKDPVENEVTLGGNVSERLPLTVAENELETSAAEVSLPSLLPQHDTSNKFETQPIKQPVRRNQREPESEVAHAANVLPKTVLRKSHRPSQNLPAIGAPKTATTQASSAQPSAS